MSWRPLAKAREASESLPVLQTGETVQPSVDEEDGDGSMGVAGCMFVAGLRLDAIVSMCGVVVSDEDFFSSAT